MTEPQIYNRVTIKNQTQTTINNQKLRTNHNNRGVKYYYNNTKRSHERLIELWLYQQYKDEKVLIKAPQNKTNEKRQKEQTNKQTSESNAKKNQKLKICRTRHYYTASRLFANISH